MAFLPLELVIGYQFLAIILSTGAAAMIAAIIQAYRSIKDGAKADEKDAISDMQNARRLEAIQRRNSEKMKDYWHSRAGELEYIVVSNLGRDKLPEPRPIPPLEVEE